MRGPLTAARLLTLFFFLLLVSICAYWLVQILAPRPAIAPSASIGDASAQANLEPATKLFGSASGIVADTPQQTNIQVFGVAEAGPNGVVILSIDGKPGVPYAVNEAIADGTLVKSVALDKVVIEQRGRLIELKTPLRASQEVLSSGVGKPRTPSEASTAPPVAARPAPPPPPPPPATAQQPQAPQSPQVEETLRQQQMLMQQQQQQAYQGQQQAGQPPEGMQQQMQGDGSGPRFRPPAPVMRNQPGGAQPVPGGQPVPGSQPFPDGQASQGGSTAISGEQQVAPLR